jgi:cell wall-associated NlpC family hydrolase
MNKKFAAAGAVIVMITSLATCSSSSPASAEQFNKQLTISQVVYKESVGSSLKEMIAQSKKLQKQHLAVLQLAENTTKLNTTIKKLKTHANKTWYVFGGATPNGWDCSGLVLWTYKQLNIDLYHSASVQKNAGKFVKASNAKPGDIVAFGWKGWKGAGHVGIYIGNGKMIHAPSPGHRTVVQTVSSFAKYYSKVTYTRIIDTN